MIDKPECCFCPHCGHLGVEPGEDGDVQVISVPEGQYAEQGDFLWAGTVYQCPDCNECFVA